ncbi:ABC transporter ATP-binding protein/permease [Spiroplasma clarkii]|nr:ABC transporter ATP-binding protein/permease [Spiroplasma clarkii]
MGKQTHIFLVSLFLKKQIKSIKERISEKMQQDLNDRIRFFSKDKFKNLFLMLKDAIRAYPGLFSVFLIVAILDALLFSGMSFVIANIVKSINNTGGNSLLGLKMYWYSWVIVGVSMVGAYAIIEFILNFLSGVWTRKIEIF